MAWRTSLQQLLPGLGITRVARVTGLDRAGIEVACAVRPEGHLLQVSNGKGATPDQAATSAVMEAAELCFAERPPAAGVDAPAEALEGEAWGPDVLGPVSALWSPGLRMRWTRARSLRDHAPVWLPAQAIFCPSSSGPSLGPCVMAWTSNGMGAHPRREPALCHALLEAIERHELAISLPQGWTEGEVRRRRVHALPRRIASWQARLERVALDVFLFDLTPSRGLRLPLAGALLFDREGGPLPLSAGYACRLDAEAALESALFEAAQSRLTDIHGARDDVSPQDRQEAGVLRAWCDASRSGGKPMSGMGGRVSSRRIVDTLAAAGFSRAAAVDLAPADLGLSVVRVVVPGLRRSELL